MIVLEELDAGKKGMSEAARNVRQVSRFLDELMANATKDADRSRPRAPRPKYTNGGKKRRHPAGCSSRRASSLGLPDSCPVTAPDNADPRQTLALRSEQPEARVTLVSKDINLRIKAAILGVHAEDYYSDKTIEDADLLYTGARSCRRTSGTARQEHASRGTSRGRTFYRVRPMVRDWAPNQFVYQPGEHGLEAVVRRIEGDAAVLELVRDYRSERHGIWGISARNREQNFALNLLLDPEIDFVTILGPRAPARRC